MATSILRSQAIRVTCELTDGVDTYINRWHSQYQGSDSSYTGVALAFRTFYAALGSYLPATVSYSRIAIARAPIADWVQQFEQLEATTGSLANRIPPQCAMRITFIPSKDPSERPRFGGPYLGPFGNTSIISGTGVFNGAVVSGVGVAVQNLNSQLEAASGGIGIGMYWKTAFEDQVRAVDSVRIGEVVDTQRSRRSSWPENYTSYPL